MFPKAGFSKIHTAAVKVSEVALFLFSVKYYLWFCHLLFTVPVVKVRIFWEGHKNLKKNSTFCWFHSIFRFFVLVNEVTKISKYCIIFCLTCKARRASKNKQTEHIVKKITQLKWPKHKKKRKYQNVMSQTFVFTLLFKKFEKKICEMFSNFVVFLTIFELYSFETFLEKKSCNLPQ